MIRFKKAQKEFEKYLKNYDLEDGKIKLKIKHTYGVVILSEYIAKDLKLNKENIKLAKLIALLHDIGRFEQLKEFNNYLDYQTIDHAELGNKILFEDNLIRKFIKTKKYDQIIKKAIQNHNNRILTPEVIDDLNEKELLHTKIIRDADKTDNFRVSLTEDFNSLFSISKEELENTKISDNMYKLFMKNEAIKYSQRETKMDCFLTILTYIFDYNFKSGLKYLKEKDYINQILNRIEYKDEDTKIKVKQIRKNALDYIENKLNQFELN